MAVALAAFPSLMFLANSQAVFDFVEDATAWAELKLSDVSLPLNATARAGDAGKVAELISTGEDVEAKDGINGRTALHEAAFSGSAETVSALLGAGADVDSLSNSGSTPLHLAAEHGHLEAVKVLVESGAAVDHVNYKSMTPLNKAAISGVAAIVKFLIDSGSSVNGVHEDGVTPLYQAAWYGHGDAVDVLLAAGADVNGMVGDGHPSITPLFSSAQNGHVDIMRKLLNEGSDPGHKGRLDALPIHAAAGYGEEDAVSLLLDAGGFDIDEENWSKMTPLLYSVIGDDHGIASILLESGANPDRKLIRQVGRVTATHLAFSANRALDGIPIVSNSGINVPLDTDRRWTPLYFALKPFSNQKMISLLLDGGADPDARLTNDATILHLAVDQFNDMDKLQLMLDAGADPNSRDATGSTPLHYAAFYGYSRTASMLIDHGAAAGTSNHFGKTPLDYTECLGNSSTAELLLERGAEPHGDAEGEAPMVAVCSVLLGNWSEMEMKLISWTAPLLKRVFLWTGDTIFWA